jgi:hypothetical protein
VDASLCDNQLVDRQSWPRLMGYTKGASPMGAQSLFCHYGATVQGEVVGERVEKTIPLERYIVRASQGWGLRGVGGCK